MGPYKVVEENKSGNKVIGTSKRTKTTLCFVPGFKSIIEGFNNIIGNIVKDCTLMCLGLGKTALTATLYDQYLSVTIQAGVPYFLALQKSVKAWEELV
mgnify:CR=1 FL=1